MKNKAIRLTAFLSIIMPLIVSGQTILAGQNSGQNIIYHDINDLFIASPNWNSSDYEYMDLNDDGVSDIMLLNDFIYYSHLNELSVHSGINTLGQLQFSSLADQPSWVRKHVAGDVIDHSLDWSPGSGILLNQWGLKGSAGVFQGEGFLAYRICNADTVYGWIRISNSASGSVAYMSVYEFAYIINLTGFKPSYETTSSDMFFVSKDCLTVIIPDNSGKDFQLKCFDVAGRLILKCNPDPGTNNYYILNGEPGLYIFSLSDQKGTIITKKAIVAKDEL
jgi:hypothetical protein